MIVIAIIAILATAGMGFYRGYIKNVEIQSVSKAIGGDLRQMRAKSMIGEGGYKWAVRFVKDAGGDYYYTYSTNGSNSTTTATTTLSLGIAFTDPPSGYKDVIFSKIAGTTTATTIVILSEGSYATNTVSAMGAIY